MGIFRLQTLPARIAAFTVALIASSTLTAVATSRAYAGTEAQVRYKRSVNQAKDLLKIKQPIVAQKKVADALRMDPNGWEALFLQAFIQHGQHDDVFAGKSVEQSLKTAPAKERATVEKLRDLIKVSLDERAQQLHGTLFEGKWEVFAIAGDRQSLYIRDTSLAGGEGSVLPLTAAREDLTVMRAYFKLPEQLWYAPLGAQSRFEVMADHACDYAKIKDNVVANISIPMLAYEAHTEIAPELQKDSPIPATLLSSRLAAIATPVGDKIVVVSGAFSCKDSPKRRFRIAQARASIDNAIDWEKLLYSKLVENRDIARTADSTHGARAITHKRSRDLATQALFLQVTQLRGYESWLEGSESAVAMETAERTQRLALVKEAIRYSMGRIAKLDSRPRGGAFRAEHLRFIEYLFKMGERRRQ